MRNLGAECRQLLANGGLPAEVTLPRERQGQKGVKVSKIREKMRAELPTIRKMIEEDKHTVASIALYLDISVASAHLYLQELDFDLHVVAKQNAYRAPKKTPYKKRKKKDGAS